MKTLNLILVLFFVAVITGFQLIKTQLTITIRNDLGNTVDGASVKLYEKEEDYSKEENVAAQGVTDAKGIVKFKELKAIPYFVQVEKEDLNNFGGGEQTSTF